MLPPPPPPNLSSNTKANENAAVRPPHGGGRGKSKPANLNVCMTVMMVEHIKQQTQQSTNKL
jgi:hypothetical protein